MEPASDSAMVSRSNGRLLTRPGWNAGAIRGARRVLLGEVGAEGGGYLVWYMFMPRGWTTDDGGMGETGEESSELVREEVPSVWEKKKEGCVGLSTEEFEERRLCDLCGTVGVRRSGSGSMTTSSGFVGRGH